MSITKNTVWGLLGNIIPLLAGLVTTPLLIDVLGMEKFGFVTMLWTLVGYLSFFDFGLGRALTKLISNDAKDTSSYVEDMLASALLVTFLLGVLGALAIYIFSDPLIMVLIKSKSNIAKDGIVAIRVAAIGIPFITLGSAYKGYLEGFERFKQTNVVKIFFGAASFILPLIFAHLIAPTLTVVALSLILGRAVSLIMLYVYSKNVKKNISIENIKKERIIDLLRFGSWMTLSNIISPMLVSIDRYFISAIAGTQLVAYYTVPYEIIVRILIIPSSLGTALFPRLSSLYTSQISEAKKIFKRSILVTFGALLISGVLISILYVPFVTLWISAEFAKTTYLIAVILTIGAVINGIAYIFYTAVQAKSGSKDTGILHTLELIVYIPILLIMINKYQILGAAIAWTIRISLDFILLAVIYKKRLK